MDKSTQIMKKLKLVGSPLKIYKKTAFIKGNLVNLFEVFNYVFSFHMFYIVLFYRYVQ